MARTSRRNSNNTQHNASRSSKRTDHPIVYPFANYARYLADSGCPDVAEQLRRDGFVFYNEEDLRSTLESDRPRPPLKEPLSRRAVEYLMSRGTYSMMSGDYKRHATWAFSIVRSRRYREVVEAILLTRLPNDQTAALISDVLWSKQEELPSDFIAFYKHYFWNVDNMSTSDWSRFLFDHSVTPPMVRYPGAGLLWTVINVPTPLAVWWIGYSDKVPINKSESMDYLFSTAFIQAVKCANVGDIPGFQKAAQVAIAAWESSRESVVDAVRVIQELKSVKLGAMSDSKPLSIGAITGGMHSDRSNLLRLVPPETHS